MVSSYDDPVKKLSREKLRDFIRNHLTKKPSELRVVCFPGAEVKGEEALEVKEVYDALGIPRENIVGLEYKRKKALLLRNAGLGIEVVRASAVDFFDETDQKFDIISLDYTGHQTMTELEVLACIAERQLLNREGIVSTNHAAKREHKNIQASMLYSYIAGIASGDIQGTPENAYQRRELSAETAAKTIFGDGEIPLPDLRDAVTSNLLKILKMGTGHDSAQEMLLKANPGFDKMMARAVAFMEEFKLNDTGDVKEKLAAKGLLPKGAEDIEPGVYDFAVPYLKMGLAEHLSKVWPMGVCLADSFIDFLLLKQTRAYLPYAIERYSYDSNKRMKMHLDIAAFRQHTRIFQRWEGLITGYFDREAADLAFDRDGLEQRNPRKLQKKVKKWARDFVEIIMAPTSIPDRVYLGSAFKQGRASAKLTKHDAVRMLREGMSSAEIARQHPEFTDHQVRAYKAHYITMGKVLR